MQHYKELGFQLEIVSDSSSEGYQLMHGLGGVGACLRYPIDIPLISQVSSDESDFENDWLRKSEEKEFCETSQSHAKDLQIRRHTRNFENGKKTNFFKSITNRYSSEDDDILEENFKMDEIVKETRENGKNNAKSDLR